MRKIEIRTRRFVNESLAGQYHSVFKGRGMEFSEVREYTPGDDIRIIDWNVTSRFGHPYVKRFVEERELTVILMVDLSGSADFGTLGRMKIDLATELSALLAFSAIRNNDRVGLLLFTDFVEKFIPPKKGKQHVLRLIRELLYFRPQSRGTDLSSSLQYLHRVIKKRSVIFIISDFISEDFEKVLKVVSRKHDVIAISISDPGEQRIPKAGLIRFEDSENGSLYLFDTAKGASRKEFERMARHQRENLNTLFRTVGIDQIQVQTDRPYEKALISFFRERARRFR